MSEQQIPIELFMPCFMTEQDFEKGYRQSKFWTEHNFMDKYREHMIATRHVAECAKIYIYKNWEKITDWTGLDVIVKHGPTGELTEYYNYVPRKKKIDSKRNETVERLFKEMEEHDKEKHNPIRVIDKVVLDPTDGDFSLTINGKEHWWIQDEAVIIIANFMEQQIQQTKINPEPIKNLPSLEKEAVNLHELENQLTEFEMVRSRINQEGFDYCFQNYSSFPEITDQKFHILREAYLMAAIDLEEYIFQMIEKLEQKISELEK